MKVHQISSNSLRDKVGQLRTGDRVLLSGTVYTARDAAHKRLLSLIDEGSPLPFPIKDCIIYYAGPTPAKKGMPVGSCGPTTSSRMDSFTPRILKMGMCAMIGKGEIAPEVIKALSENNAVYLCAVGGAGALIAKHIVTADEVAFPELGCESIKRLTVSDMPQIVGVDNMGNSIFEH